MTHLTAPVAYGVLQNDPEKAMLKPIDFTEIFMAQPLSPNFDGSLGTDAEFALNVMRNAKIDLTKYDTLPRKPGVAEGDVDCFTWDGNKNPRTEENPFPVVFDSMSNPSAYVGYVRKSSRLSKKTTWQTLPWWFFELTGKNDWESIRDEWKSNLLSLAFQAYLLLSQEYLFLNTNYRYERRYQFGEITHTETYFGENWLHLIYDDYIEAGYEYMNHALRIHPRYDQEMCLVGDQVNRLELLQWMIALMPMTVAATKVYRYSQLTPQLDGAVEGDVLTFRGYTSVTMNLINTINIVNLLAGSNMVNRNDHIVKSGQYIPPQRNMVLMEMLLPRGSQFLIVPSPENELILPHYCQFVVVQKLQVTDRITYMYLELVNDPTACTRANF